MGKRGNRSRRRGQSDQNRAGQGRAERDQPAQDRSGQDRSGRNRSNRKRSPSQQKKKSIPFDPEKHYLPDTPPEREYAPCELSGEAIDDIVTAIAHPRSGKPVRFDSVLKTLLDQEREELAEDERLAYLGRGTFGIIKIVRNASNRPELVVRKYFHYEDTHDRQGWRRELAPGISRDYVPDPQPLADLYTSQEISSFPRFEPAGSSGSSRGS
jgi:hypothetical protein